MSRGPKRNYTKRIVSPKVRASKFPYLPERIEEILNHYGYNVSQLARRTRIKQSGLSKCLNGHSLISEPSVHLLSRILDDPIPMWWLAAGADAAPLAEVLANEQGVPLPDPPTKTVDDLMEKFKLVLARTEDDEVARYHRPIKDMIDLAWAEAQRRPLVTTSPGKNKTRKRHTIDTSVGKNLNDSK